MRQFEYAVALARHLSFRRAAQACAVSQPGLSAQIQQLEETLGVELFERTRRKVLITPAGREVVERARRILLMTDDLVETARTQSGPLTGELKLGVIPTIAPYLLPQFTAQVRKRFPGLRVWIQEGQTADLVERLAVGDLDLLLLALEAELGNVETRPLFRDRFVLAMPRKHPLTRKKSITPHDLKDEAILVLQDGHCFKDQVLEACARAGDIPVGDFRASSLPTLTQMVAGGSGLTYLPEMAVRVEARPGSGVVTRPLRGPAPYRTICLAWRPSSPRADAYEALGEIVSEAVT